MNQPARPDAKLDADNCLPVEIRTTQFEWKLLDDIPSEQQKQGRWCWAAVAAAIAHYYKTGIEQCEIANDQLGRDDCCKVKDNTDGPHNSEGFLMSALYSVGHFEKWEVLTQATPVEIRKEIKKKRPVCVRLVWQQNTGHFVTVAGHVDGAAKPAPQPQEGEETVPAEPPPIDAFAISDPFWGLSDIDGADFATNYAYGAAWTDSYYTRP